MMSFSIDPQFMQYGAPALAAGLALGALVTWLFMRGHQARSARDVAALETRIKNQDSLQQEREIAFEAANAQLTRAFTELANQSLKSNSENFLRLAEQNLGAQQEKAKHAFGEREKAVENMVKPIQKALEAAQKQISDLEKSRSEAYGSIRTQLEAMQESQKSLRQETQNLVNALRRPEVRGRWGEITLRRLVELAGMVEHCDFQEQVHTVVIRCLIV